MRRYRQNILIGRNKRPAILETRIKDNCVLFVVICKGGIEATRTTSRTQNEEIAIRRLAKAVNGMAYVFIVPVEAEKTKTKERYFKVNN